MTCTCDLCDAVCKPTELVQLFPEYRSAGVTDVCPACAKWVTNEKFKLLAEHAPKLRALIAERRGREPESSVRRRWWERFFKRS